MPSSIEFLASPNGKRGGGGASTGSRTTASASTAATSSTTASTTTSSPARSTLSLDTDRSGLFFLVTIVVMVTFNHVWESGLYDRFWCC